MSRAEIIIPCYNEFENIEKLYAECCRIVELSNGSIGFILVNNGSTDGTSDFFESNQNIGFGVRFTSIESNQGYGGGILAGLVVSSADFIGWTHADLQTPLIDCLRALEILKMDYDFVKGSRIGRPFIDKFFSKGMEYFESTLFGVQLREINAQPTLFSRDLYDNWQNVPNDFSIDLYALVMAAKSNAAIARFDVTFLPRVHGSSKWNSGFKSRVRFIKRTIKFSLELNRRFP
jgi:glycosyltransferase involved in cell wall biosynthesis